MHRTKILRYEYRIEKIWTIFSIGIRTSSGKTAPIKIKDVLAEFSSEPFCIKLHCGWCSVSKHNEINIFINTPKCPP